MKISDGRSVVLNRSDSWAYAGSRRLSLASVVAGCLLLVANPAVAQTPEGTDRVEEDWVLMIRDTSFDETAPQIINAISPVETIEAEYGVLELNHTTQPDYVDGGIQLQRWNGQFLCDYRPPTAHYRLATANEQITYTITMKIENGNLVFGVKNGKSQTWGDFGGETEQWRTQTTSPYPDLGRYDRLTSTGRSRIAFAPNLVESFTQTKVRYYRAGQLIKTDETGVKVESTANQNP